MYRHVEQSTTLTYKHPLLVRYKRLYWRFLAWKSKPLQRPQCWACLNTFKPERRERIFRDTTCSWLCLWHLHKELCGRYPNLASSRWDSRKEYEQKLMLLGILLPRKNP
jgi:hypothetical protein